MLRYTLALLFLLPTIALADISEETAQSYVDEVVEFFVHYEAEDMRADINADGVVSGEDVKDLGSMLALKYGLIPADPNEGLE